MPGLDIAPASIDHIADYAKAGFPVWLNTDSRARVLTDENRVVQWANKTALAMFSEGRDVRLGAQVMQVCDPAQGVVFERLVRNAGSAPVNWCYASHERDRAVVFVIQRLTGSREKEGVLIGLTFHVASAEYTPSFADFSTVFELTPTEFKMISQLLQGRGVDGAAVKLGISVETARTHIRNAYGKMRVSSREEMFRALAPYRVS